MTRGRALRPAVCGGVLSDGQRTPDLSSFSSAGEGQERGGKLGLVSDARCRLQSGFEGGFVIPLRLGCKSDESPGDRPLCAPTPN